MAAAVEVGLELGIYAYGGPVHSGDVYVLGQQVISVGGIGGGGKIHGEAVQLVLGLYEVRHFPGTLAVEGYFAFLAAFGYIGVAAADGPEIVKIPICKSAL